MQPKGVLHQLDVDLGKRSYRIHIGRDFIQTIPQWLESIHTPGRSLIVTDDRVHRIYRSRIDSLASCLPNCCVLAVRPGERSKSLRIATRIYRFMVQNGFDRDSLVIAFGGGMIGDLAGFVAATYMRGIRFAQVPTTLLAQVDASVGGKVAVNLPEGKNLVGAFHQPIAVFADVTFLHSLEPRHFRSGMGEVVKSAIIGNQVLFEELESEPVVQPAMRTEFLASMVHRCCRLKAGIVARDEYELGLRAVLNLGHTIGHAVEAHGNFRSVLHGEAVVFGTLVAGRIAVRRKRFDPMEYRRLLVLVNRLQLLHLFRPPDPDSLLPFLSSDKKRRGSVLIFVLPEKIGRVVLVEDISFAEIRSAIAEVIASLPGF